MYILYNVCTCANIHILSFIFGWRNELDKANFTCTSCRGSCVSHCDVESSGIFVPVLFEHFYIHTLKIFWFLIRMLNSWVLPKPNLLQLWIFIRREESFIFAILLYRSSFRWLVIQFQSLELELPGYSICMIHTLLIYTPGNVASVLVVSPSNSSVPPKSIFFVKWCWIASRSARNLVIFGDHNWDLQSRRLRTNIALRSNMVFLFMVLDDLKIHAAIRMLSAVILAKCTRRVASLLMWFPRSYDNSNYRKALPAGSMHSKRTLCVAW